MRDFPTDDKFFTVGLEDLSWGWRLLPFSNCLFYLDLVGADLIAALNSASENCLYSAAKARQESKQRALANSGGSILRARFSRNSAVCSVMRERWWGIRPRRESTP